MEKTQKNNRLCFIMMKFIRMKVTFQFVLKDKFKLI